MLAQFGADFFGKGLRPLGRRHKLVDCSNLEELRVFPVIGDILRRRGKDVKYPSNAVMSYFTIGRSKTREPRRTLRITKALVSGVSFVTYFFSSRGGAISCGKLFRATSREREDVFFASSVVLSTRVPFST